MGLENLKISEDRSQEIAKKMKETKVLEESVSVETAEAAKNVISSLDNAKLATFIETQFKSGEKRKLYSEMVSDPMYVFSVQSALDALGYDSLLTGNDNNYGIDEIYASRTKAAVKKFQEDMGLVGKDVDGLVGEKTFNLLLTELRKYEAPVVINQTQNPKFGPILSPTDDGTPVSVEKSSKSAVYTSLDQFVTNAYSKLPLYKSDVLVDYAGMQKSIGWVVMQMFNMGGRTESSVLESYEKYKDKIIGDPILNAYILYKSMKGVGTYDKVINKIFADNNGKMDDIYVAFGKVDNQTLLDYLISDFGGYWSLADSRFALNKYVIQLGDESSVARKDILANKNFVTRGQGDLDLSKKGHLYSLNAKIAEWKNLENQQIANK